jgi:hypothetical protein
MTASSLLHPGAPLAVAAQTAQHCPAHMTYLPRASGAGDHPRRRLLPSAPGRGR